MTAAAGAGWPRQPVAAASLSCRHADGHPRVRRRTRNQHHVFDTGITHPTSTVEAPYPQATHARTGSRTGRSSASTERRRRIIGSDNGRDGDPHVTGFAAAGSSKPGLTVRLPIRRRAPRRRDHPAGRCAGALLACPRRRASSLGGRSASMGIRPSGEGRDRARVELFVVDTGTPPGATLRAVEVRAAAPDAWRRGNATAVRIRHDAVRTSRSAWGLDDVPRDETGVADPSSPARA
jgi:hypothetical protein